MNYLSKQSSQSKHPFLSILVLALIGLLIIPMISHGEGEGGILPSEAPPPAEEGTPPDSTTTDPDIDGTSQIDIILLEAVLSLSL